MKLLEKTFLILSCLIPAVFLLLMVLNYDKVKKNKKARIRLLTVILVSFLLNFIGFRVIKMYNEKEISSTTSKEVEASITTKKEFSEPETTTVKNSEITTITTTKIANTTKQVTKTITTTSKSQSPVNTSSTTSKGYKIETINGITYVDGVLIANKTYPLPESYVPTDTHKTASNDTGTCAECINESAYQAFVKMKNDATNDGLNIWIQSGYRSYNYQKALYNGYVNKSGKVAADTYSARPGHSEHQTGLAFDLNSITDAFANTKEGIWINENCYKYGFILRYPKGKDNETGYKYESWHLRYVGTDLASKLYNGGDWITLESYFGITSIYIN